MNRQKKVAALTTIYESLLEDSRDLYLIQIDLCDSTSFKQKYIEGKLPDNEWLIRQLIFLHKCAEFIRLNNGSIVKTMGDAVLASFDILTNPEEVLKCGIEIVQGYANVNPYRGDSKISVKVSIDVGLTYNGTIVEKNYDPIGTPVDRCFRLNSIAKANEIIVSENFFEILKGHDEQNKLNKYNELIEKFGFVSRHEELKGLGETHCYSFIAQ